jgi:putative YphP/YqiW family bacilliredoxin
MYQINSKPPIYDQVAVQPMRDELTFVGFKELLTPESVIQNVLVKDDETKLLFINSVCGCSAGSARPGVALALQHNKIPNKLFTSFAGNDRDAVDTIRENFLTQFPPSSPGIVITKNGETIYYMGRSDIMDKSPEEISKILTAVFDSIEGVEGPSIEPENYKQLVHAISCGSKLPLHSN